ncbi:dehydratase [Lithospermum erythrorhizon]|uniref:Dihydroflavonol 4-reductase n=1 Tax=Lithospermum erythrorhizon TaxID=34254 RepID=A0AAV3PA32_LITER
MAEREGEVVCVTGASGFIGSWIVCFLLERGYTVHGTVKNINDEEETKHLEALEEAESRLRLFQIDLLDYDSIAAALRGTTGVFHLATPNTVDRVDDPENMIVKPAVEGTKNVLTAAKELGVRRVVVTSSISAFKPNPSWPADRVIDEESWTDMDYCRNNEIWYSLSKTMAEKLTWKFAKEKDLDVVVINPAIVIGPMLPPVVGSSMKVLQGLLQGNNFSYLLHFL